MNYETLNLEGECKELRSRIQGLEQFALTARPEEKNDSFQLRSLYSRKLEYLRAKIELTSYQTGGADRDVRRIREPICTEEVEQFEKEQSDWQKAHDVIADRIAERESQRRAAHDTPSFDRIIWTGSQVSLVAWIVECYEKGMLKKADDANDAFRRYAPHFQLADGKPINVESALKTYRK